jgi:hypothetical protein
MDTISKISKNDFYNKKFLVAFRGAYDYVKNPTMVCYNIIKNVITSTTYDVDVYFFTYDNDLDKLKIYDYYLKPKKIYFTEDGQIENFKESLQILENYYKNYDYVLFLRFDIIYKMPILNLCTKDGITFTYKEDTIEIFKTFGLYGDVIICISSSHFSEIRNALLCENAGVEYFPHRTLHSLSSIINKRFPNVPTNTMIDGYYQSNTSMPVGDQRLNPIYIQVRHPYHGIDRLLYFDE